MQYTASLQVRPTAMIDDGACQPCALSASDNQNPSTVADVHVRRLRGVTSLSMFDHLSGSAKLAACLGIIHPAGVLFLAIFSFVRSNRFLR